MSKWAGRLLVCTLSVGALAIGVALRLPDNLPSVEALTLEKESLSKQGIGTNAAESVPANRPIAQASEKVRSSGSSVASSEALFVSEYKTLSTRAQRGDSAAASKLFLDSEKCLTAMRTVRRVEQEIRDSEFRRNDPESNAIMQGPGAEDKFLADWEVQLHAAHQSSALCDGSDTILSDVAAFAIRLQAAKLGDSDAAACYVHGRTLDGGYAANDEFFAEYRRNAMLFVDAGVKAGDWRMVRLMLSAYGPVGLYHRHMSRPAVLSERLVKPDPVAHYQYIKLISLAETGTNEWDVYRQALPYKASQLAAGDVAQGDDWAAKTYSNYFRSSTNFNALICPE